MKHTLALLRMTALFLAVILVLALAHRVFEPRVEPKPAARVTCEVPFCWRA